MQWWSDVWTNVARFFGYEEWMWGSAADWFAALGTVGALFLALRLYARDRRNAQKAHANSFTVTWVHQSLAADGRPEVDYYFHNAGSMPIYDAAIVEPTQDGMTPIIAWMNDQKPILPGEHGEARIAVKNMRLIHDAHVSFMDGTGKQWEREFGGMKYFRRSGGLVGLFYRLRYMRYLLRQRLTKAVETRRRKRPAKRRRG